MNWIYEGETVINAPKGHYGFIYMITYNDGTKYIGKKSLWDYKTLPALKNGKVRDKAKRIGKNIKGKREYFDIVSKESNWKKYTGSSKLTKDKKIIKKEILEWAKTKRHLTYLETKYLFEYSVLENDKFLNENILGKFYKGNII